LDVLYKEVVNTLLDREYDKVRNNVEVLAKKLNINPEDLIDYFLVTSLERIENFNSIADAIKDVNKFKDKK